VKESQVILENNYHSPIVSASTDIKDKTSNDLLAARRVCNLRVELDAIKWLRVVRDCSEWCGIRAADDMEVGRKLR